MGLDMYGYTMNAEFVGDRQTDVNVSEDERDGAGLNQLETFAKSPPNPLNSHQDI